MGLRRIRCTFGIEMSDTVKVTALAKDVAAAMEKDQATYSAPNPPLNILKDQIKDVESAQLLVRNKTPGAAAMRDQKRNVLVTSMENERMYVQTLADAAPSPEQAIAIIQGAALKVVAFPVNARDALEAKQGQASGSVDLTANVHLLVEKPKGRRCFLWEYTTNGGQTWNAAPSTPFASTTIANLPPLTVCSFRVAVKDRSGQSAWSPVVSIVVH